MGVGHGLSMRAGAGITGGCAGAYAKASKKDKGRILGWGLRGHGWSRDNVRWRLVVAAECPLPRYWLLVVGAGAGRRPAVGPGLAVGPVPGGPLA